MQRFHDVKLSHEKRLASRIRFARKHLSFKDSNFSIANLDTLLDNTSAFHKTKLDRFIEDERVKLKKAIDTRSAQVSLDEPPQCPVCLRDDIASSILVLRSCKHFLCAVCASQVILEANSKHRTPRCPYCRTNFMSENAVLHPDKPINSVRQLHAFIKQNM
ncbi:Tripartite motif-containing protein 5 [Hondaea fermentalgiana]|uniref:Tripartite motif-containing protein 5 n=1 Tax=Hondaea fermentalgiana TaxID=2315210 RepID=A0A2R5GVS6_9STRA|nr:Tripartite motif-containing protein 5 [Hondaea fermentalgiana]|eukprot:GBG32024.1 Tripartite motif-containing protein 5 [Hondaea fermentalgiana]